jgi:hypothetical protein
MGTPGVVKLEVRCRQLARKGVLPGGTDRACVLRPPSKSPLGPLLEVDYTFFYSRVLGPRGDQDGARRHPCVLVCQNLSGAFQGLTGNMEMALSFTWVTWAGAQAYQA